MCGGKNVWEQVYVVIVDRHHTECDSVGRGHKDHSLFITSALLLSSHGSYMWHDSIALFDNVFKVVYYKM